MSTLVLARKYRPKTFAQLAGQDHVVKALTHALESNRLHHAYLFTGTRGIGKTTVSRILAKSLNCTGSDGQGGVTAQPCGVCPACQAIDADRFMDYTELDAASNRSIDEVRDLIERAAYKPSVGRYKVFMIDEAHQLTKDAFNALLKTLEEPPEYLKFVLATTDPEKMLPTVLSRCLQFNLRPMASDTVQAHLAEVLHSESISFEAGALRLLARAARGSMRDALSLTDQAIAFGGGQVQESGVRAMLGVAREDLAFEMLQSLGSRDGAGVLAAVQRLRETGGSAASTLEHMAQWLQAIAIEQTVPGSAGTDAQDQDREQVQVQVLAQQWAPDETQLAYSIALHGRAELSILADEYAALTMVLLRFLAFPPASSTSAAATRTASLRTSPSPSTAVRLPVRAIASEASEFEPQEAAPPKVKTSDPNLADRWDTLVRSWMNQGTISGLTRELAWQAGLDSVKEAAGARAAIWTLRVEHESLRTPALQEKLQAALASSLGAQVSLELIEGVATDTPAQRDAAQRAQRQQAAEATIRQDPDVIELLKQFKSAKVVPGSIKPR